MEKCLQYLLRKDIDDAKWNQLVATSLHPMVYAHTRFLDAMSPDWHALILDDYAAAMPLTKRSKFGISYLCQPAFAQQLGIFSRETISESVEKSFLATAAKKFKLIEIYLHHGHPANAKQGMHQNFILNLQADYETIRAGYKKDLLKNLARAGKYDLRYRPASETSTAIKLYLETYGDRLGYRDADFTQLGKLCTEWMQEGHCLVREVYLHDQGKETLLATGLFLKDHQRIYNIASTTLPNGRMLEANHVLFDELIREFAGQALVLDFEGSDLAGIARFYQKFGPESQPYFFWKSNLLPAWIQWLKP